MSDNLQIDYLNIHEKCDLLNIYGKFMYLKIFVDSSDNELINKYIQVIKEHNLKIFNNINHIDAGFDLLSPDNLQFNNLPNTINKLDYKVTCSARIIKKDYSYNTGFYMYPRSSISKSKLRLANNVGIIDAGYRGHLIGMFDCISNNIEIVNKFDRHLQICAPCLIPIIVELVKSREELGEETVRGSGGFGSTGK
jgi:dUTP pyrophosphatase